jgi:ParB/RepB/Spo0J family partition protein
MDTAQFSSHVRHIPLSHIRPSHHNPRGPIQKNESFERLVSSIREVDILVPLVVRELKHPDGAIKYELVDGERRYWAATELALERVPAHILTGDYPKRELRMMMFHLHMTRQQWEPLAQCRSLSEAYPELDNGLKFTEKTSWTQKLAEETGMPEVTARDRVHVLAWGKDLKQKIYEFDDHLPSKKIYSYALAIEASIVEPSLHAFPNYYNHGTPPEATANQVRASMLSKTIAGLQTGVVKSREQIRSVSAIFLDKLTPPQKRIAQGVFRALVSDADFQFDDAKAEITAKLPEVLRESPKPQRLVAMIKTLSRNLQDFDPAFIDEARISKPKREKLKEELKTALEELLESAQTLEEKLNAH